MSTIEPEVRRRRFRWRYVVAALVLVLIVVLVFKRGGEEEAETEAVVDAETARAEVKTLAITLDALGTVQPLAGHVADISAPESSRVLRVYVAVGDFVRAGQPLVQLDGSVFEARRHEAEIALVTAQQAFDRAQRLLAEGISPRKDVESAASELARTRADLEEAQRTEALATLRSPISGVVVMLNATLSQPVDVTAPVVEVLDPRGLEILFHIAPNDAGRIATGSDVELSSGQEPQRFLIGHGTIRGVSAAVDSATGSVDVRATIATPTRLLKSGETVSGKIVVSQLRNAIVVPLDALVPEGDGIQVFVVDAEGVAHATLVTVGYRTETEAQIIAGLKGGELVVTRGAYGVTDSAKVQTNKEGPGTGAVRDPPEKALESTSK